MAQKFITNSAKETQELGEKLALRLRASTELSRMSSGQAREIKSRKTAAVLALQGDMGGGKTSFLQGFAKGLGVKEKILSPTFVIMKKFGRFYHFDCYRINKPEEILELGFKEIIFNPENIVAIEWPEKIKKILPKNMIKIKFKFINENKREILFV